MGQSLSKPLIWIMKACVAKHDKPLKARFMRVFYCLENSYISITPIVFSSKVMYSNGFA